MKNLDLITMPWADYELMDSGDNKKLERFGNMVVIRPETQALWQLQRPQLWMRAQAEFKFAQGRGKWSFGSAKDKKSQKAPDFWKMEWRDVRCRLQFTNFKHTGVFPEQAPNWEWITEKVKTMPTSRVLNLFGYTGVASIVAAQAGAQVTHVDASKQSNAWAKENAELSGIKDGIRFITDDALKFAEREIRRGSFYDGIILDPPAFGRGPKGEVWHIEEHLPTLLSAASKLLSKRSGAFFLLNGYAAGYSANSFLQAVEDNFAGPEKEFGELQIQESGSERVVPAGIYVRFRL